jgi:hypothetical protein
MSSAFPDQKPIGRIVGAQDRSEIETDAVKAYRRGRVLDRMLHAADPPRPRGVTRGSHEYFNRVDAERQVQIARRLNAA